MGNEALVARISALVEPLLADAAAELVEVEVRGSRGRRLVRITVDREGGIDVDTLASLSVDIGAALDDADLVDGRYTLEVSSPGADRPLRDLRDFRRNVGRQVEVIRHAGAPVTGLLRAVDADRLTLEVDGATLEVPLAEVVRGQVVLPW